MQHYWWRVALASREGKFSTPYQAVLLPNGSVYFGKLEGYGGPHPVLTEVYYIVSQTNPDTKQRPQAKNRARGQSSFARRATTVSVPNASLSVGPTRPCQLTKAARIVSNLWGYGICRAHPVRCVINPPIPPAARSRGVRSEE